LAYAGNIDIEGIAELHEAIAIFRRGDFEAEKNLDRGYGY